MEVFTGKLKFNTIADWLDEFALKEKAKPFESQSQKKKTQKEQAWKSFPGVVAMSAKDSESLVFNEERCVLLSESCVLLSESWVLSWDPPPYTTQLTNPWTAWLGKARGLGRRVVMVLPSTFLGAASSLCTQQVGLVVPTSS